ncbi:hypothetical protein M0805_000739 [Coniferiporia weirii]|nr:hypothetical protein M0805_000739 [Coniferiporia weirii]
MLSSRPASLLHDELDVSMYSRHTASKTPGRALKGRAGLQENVFQHGSMTTNPNEKRANLKTPFRQESSKMILQDGPAPSKTMALSTRLLVDKTPLPNRQNLSLFTPLPRNGKTAKFALPALLDENESGTPVQPPSSSRKKLRVPRSASKSFETPNTKGDHWNVSDVSIDLGGTSLDEVDEVDANEPDYSEPEYMPPKPIEPAYEPAFELPDYKNVGQTLLTFAHSYPVGDTPSYMYEVDSEDLLKGCGWTSSPGTVDLNLPGIDEDDIFDTRVTAEKPEAKRNARAVPSKAPVKRTTGAAVPRLNRAPSAMRTKVPPPQPARPATSAAIRAPDPKPVAFIPRPGSVVGMRRPLTRATTAYSTSGTRPRSGTSNTITAPPPKPLARKISARPEIDELVQSLSETSGNLEPQEDFRFDV